MSNDPAWAFCALLALAAVLARLPPMQSLDAEADNPARHAGVDGLRGFLALGVFAFHLVVTRRFIETGVWKSPDSPFYALLGPVGVSMFFMITGFLFWGKLLRAGGRPRWTDLYIGRVFRIAPMYLAVVLAMLGIVFWRSGGELHEPAAVVARAVLQWLALGWLDGQPDVNGVQAAHLLAGVTWTIWYEWLFYASLLLLAPLARGRRHLWSVAVALAACVAGRLWLHSHQLGLATLFLAGMMSASLLHEGIQPRLSDRTTSLLAAGLLGMVALLLPGGYGSLLGGLLAGVFYLVCSGATLFGLLTSAPARRLGAISYSLYLMQGLVLTLVFSVPDLRSASLASPAAFWLAGALSLTLLVLVSLGGYRWIEVPGIAWGRRLQQRLRDAIDRRAGPRDQRSRNQVGENAVNPGL